MKVHSLALGLLTVALGAISVLAATDAKTATPASGQLEQRRQEMLKRFDLNGDGKLDEDEKAAMKEAQRQQRAVRGSGDIGSMSNEAGRGGEGRGGLFVREMIRRFDKDGDGKLDQTELAEAMKARADFGRNQGPGGPGGQMRGQMMKMFDKNGDGKIDDEERAAAEKFRDDQIKRFDKDGDGRLDPEERAEAMKAYLADHPEMAPPGA